MDCQQSKRISVIVAALLSWTGSSAENPDCKKQGRAFLIQESCKNGVSVFNLNESDVSHLTSRVTTLVIPILYTAVFVIGLPANMAALWVLLTKMKRAPSTILLTNLALADLLLIIFLPFKIAYHFLGNHWIFGEPLCRTLTAGFYGNMYGSILCLMFISIDRYVALVHPFSAKSFRSNKLAVSACVVVWVLGVGSMSPFIFTQQSYSFNNTNFTTCHDALPKGLQTSLFFYCFLLLFGFGFLREAAGWVSQHSGTQSSQRTRDVCLSNRSKSGEAI